MRANSGSGLPVSEPGAGWRARRVPGADYHEGQGGSQRRGTRWMMSCELQNSFRNFDLVRHHWYVDKRYTNARSGTRIMDGRMTLILAAECQSPPVAANS